MVFRSLACALNSGFACMQHVSFCALALLMFPDFNVSRFSCADIASCPAQTDLGSISSEIKNLQEQSMSMGIKLKNRKVYHFHTWIVIMVISCNYVIQLLWERVFFFDRNEVFRYEVPR